MGLQQFPDRVEPRRAVGPLFGLGAFLTLCCLWVNAEIGRIMPAPEAINWELRTVIVVILDFLVADVDAEYPRIAALGVGWVLPPTTQPWGSRSMIFNDPEGNLVMPVQQ